MLQPRGQGLVRPVGCMKKKIATMVEWDRVDNPER